MNFKINKAAYGYLFISPFYIIYGIFGLVPILYTFYISLTNWNGFSKPEFVGFANYNRLLHDSFFYQTIGNTLIIWIMSIVPQLILALVLALILDEKFVRGKHFFRAVYYFPHLVSAVTLGVIFSMLFDWQSGTMNKVLMSIGILHHPIHWLASTWWARAIDAGVICWQFFGFNMIVFIAGLKSISSDMMEAAQVDGASTMQTLMHIKIPLLRPVFIFTLITSVIGGLQLFEAPLMIGDGPDNTARTMIMYLYETAFKAFHYSYAAAIAYGIFIIVMFFTLITIKASNLKNSMGGK